MAGRWFNSHVVNINAHLPDLQEKIDELILDYVIEDGWRKGCWMMKS